MLIDIFILYCPMYFDQSHGNRIIFFHFYRYVFISTDHSMPVEKFWNLLSDKKNMKLLKMQ